MMCSQMKTFFDMTGTLWQNGALVGTPVTAFTSTGSQVCTLATWPNAPCCAPRPRHLVIPTQSTLVGRE